MPSPDPPELDPPGLSEARSLLADVLTSVEQHGTLFGGYLLFEKLGHGGSGVVYRARRVGSDTIVALKQMRGGAQATAEERRDFLAGAKTLAGLAHSEHAVGIAPVLDFGEHEGCPFYTMPLFEGGDLAAALADGRPSQAQAARWIAAAAKAVDYAHSKRVLHCDLKPANILLDANGSAWVADFGSARKLSEHGACDESGSGLLSYYMAPEQGIIGMRGLTRQADIYSLGVVLYELLSGRVPYEELGFAHWFVALATAEPIRAPSEFEPGVNPHLELICLKCLEKEPSARYSSAALLAEDLELVLAGWSPLHARPPRVMSRSLRWLRRHPSLAFVFAAVLVLATAVSVALLSIWQDDREQQQAALETNGFIANSQAGALLFQLREFADRIEHCARQPSVAALLRRGEVAEEANLGQVCGAGFREVYLFDVSGRLLAHEPPAKQSILGKSYAFRGYFRGARELAERGLPGAFLGPAYRSESNEQLQFALGVPVHDANGDWLGVAAGSLEVASTIGQVGLTDASGGGRVVALLGPRDHDRAATQTPRLDFIIHPHLAHGREVAVADPSRAILRLAPVAPPGEQFALHWSAPLLQSDYRDPLLPSLTPSLAAFAPVGRTGYVVAIQTPTSAVLSHGRNLANRLVWRAGAPGALGLGFLSLFMLRSASRRTKLERRPGAKTAS
ncbi:MAG TPA: protein kinase [Polyangiaceae bacterium]|nr:protein kinase [Polyangiaceae bacterium]